LTVLCAAAFAQQPRIDSISPSQGPIAGGTIVTIAGAGFTGAAVKLDRGAIAPLSQSDSEIRLQMPQHDNGIAVIRVGNAVPLSSCTFRRLCAICRPDTSPQSRGSAPSRAITVRRRRRS